MAMFNLHALIRTETREQVCPSPLFALSAAFGLLPQVCNCHVTAM